MVQRSEWTQLAPLDGLVHAPDLTAPSRPFMAGLTGRQTPDPILQPLGHHRDPSGPGGLVSDIAVARPLTAAPYAPATPLVLPPPVQRMIDMGQDESQLSDDSSAPDLPSRGDAAEPLTTLPPAPPIQRLAVIDMPATATRTSLTRVGPEAGVAPLAPRAPGNETAQRSPQRPLEPALPAMPAMDVQRVAAPSPTAPPRLTLGESRRLGLGPPLQRMASAGAAAAAPAAQPVSPTAAVDVQRSTVTGTPRVAPAAPAMPAPEPRPVPSLEQTAPRPRPSSGLGAPLAFGPGKVSLPVVRTTPLVLQRSPEPTEPRDTSDLAPGVQDAPRTSDGSDPSAPAAVDVSVPAVQGSLEVSAAAVQRSLEVVPARSQRPEPSGSMVAPVVARRPLVDTGIHTARSASVPLVQRSGPVDMPAVHRGDDAARQATQMGAHAFTRDPDLYIPAEHGPLDRGPGAALLAHELTHVRQQRLLGDDLPAESSDDGQRLESDARSAEQGYEFPSLMALPPVRRPAATQSAPSGIMPALVATGDAGPFHDPEMVMGWPAVEPRPAAQRADAEAVTVSAGPAASRSEEDLDDLARRLYGRLRNRLHRELLIDRERSGMITDLR